MTPAVRRILAQADFSVVGSTARAELRLPFQLDELTASWIEVLRGKRPVRSLTGHWTRRALRWADASLRAERAPIALDPTATREDWTALAAAAAAAISRRVPLASPAYLAEAMESSSAILGLYHGTSARFIQIRQSGGRRTIDPDTPGLSRVS